MSYRRKKEGKMEAIKKGFGEQLKNIRKLKDLTQERLSENAGINQRQLARIEAGESFVTAETLGNLCLALEVEPNVLFDFKIKREYYQTGTDTRVHFSVIKSGNIYQLVNKPIKTTDQKSEKEQLDETMFKMAKRLKKDITVDEVVEGKVVGTRIYRPNGQIEVTLSDVNDQYNELLESLTKISTDKNKLQFVSTALEVINKPDKESLTRLKLMIQGLEIRDKYDK